MSIKIKCHICDSVCGVRPPVTIKMMKGATVRLVATCRSCNQPPPKPNYVPPKDFDFNDLLKTFGMN